MLAFVSWNGERPVVSLIPVGEGEALTLDLLAQSDNLILELPDENEIIAKQMIQAPQEASD